MSETEYTFDVQAILLSYMLADPTAFSMSQNILDPENFDNRLRKAVRFILDFSEQYRTLPTLGQIKAHTGIAVDPFEENIDPFREWYLETIEGFSRHKALERAVIEGVDLINEGKAGELERRIKDAMAISLMRDLGTEYFKDPKTRLENMRDRSNYVSTGWSVIDDKLYGGFTPGALNVFAGGSGCIVAGTLVRVRHNGLVSLVPIEHLDGVNRGLRMEADSPDGFVPIEEWRNKGIKRCITFVTRAGRTITASHDHLFQKADGEWLYARDFREGDSLLTKSGSDRVIRMRDAGHQVVYDLAIGHENHRYYTNGISSHNSGKSLFLQNIALNWVFANKNVIYFTLELSEDLVSLRLDAMVAEISTKDVFRDIDKAALAIKMRSKQAGTLIVKKLPEAGTTANDLRAFLKEYQIKTGIRPDAIIVDYLDLMHPNNRKINPSDLFVKDKYTSEEMRALAGEYGLLCVTASQLNRSSVEASEFDHSHIAGGISKINTADNVFGIFTSSTMRERGVYQLQFLKTRSSSAVGQKIDLAFDNTTLRITDPDDYDPKFKPKSNQDLRREMQEKAKADDQKDVETKSDTKPSKKPEAEAKTAPSETRTRAIDLMARINAAKTK